MEEASRRPPKETTADQPAETPGGETADQPAETPGGETPDGSVAETSSQVEDKIIERESPDFSSLEPKDYGIEFQDDEFKYAPPNEDDTLPDIHRLLASLESGDTDLEATHDPPALFTRPENVDKYRKITELHIQMETEPSKEYVTEFEEGIRDDVLMVSSIRLEDVQEEERRLRDEHVAYLEQEQQRQAALTREVLSREEQAKRRVAVYLTERRNEIARKEELLKQKERLLMDRLHKSFRYAENHLVDRLESRKGEVKTLYGDLTMTEGQFGGSKGRRWKVDWDRTPQPIQVKLKCLRGIKDKLPGGRYVMMVSLYNKLGGHVLRWSKLKGQQWGGATLPIGHDGHFYNVEMKIDQSMFTVLPSQPSIRPGMVIVFELFLLRGAVVSSDRVVGWGAFPISNGQFEIVEGKYKCPFLRGEMDPNIDRHETIEQLIAADVDHWLSNLYFEVVKLPRYLAGQKEYEVELQFSSALTAYPDRLRTGEEYRDGEKPVPGSIPDVQSPENTSQSLVSLDSVNSRQSVDSVAKIKFGDDYVKKPAKKAELHGVSAYGSRAMRFKERHLELSDTDDSGDEDIYKLHKLQDFKPVTGVTGMYYKKYSNNPADIYHKKMFSMLPKTDILASSKPKRKLTHLEELEQHTFSVQPPFSTKGRLSKESSEKLSYLRRQFLAEMGLSQWRSREFWGMLLVFVIVFFLRMYMHYVAQWLVLNAMEIPINRFEFLPYTVNLNYQATLLNSLQEVSVVIIGPMFNVFLFALLIFISWLCQRLLGPFPQIGSKFIIGFGLFTFLNPYLILIVDCILKRYLNQGGSEPIADFAKLWWHFLRSEGSGLAGIFITAFVYVCASFVTASALYMYFLRLHNNGSLLDIFWRLHGKEEKFFVPYDLEMSNQELCYLCKKAEQWRGEEGERRKVAVYDYVWTEVDMDDNIWDSEDNKRKLDDEKGEVTTHTSIHTLHLDGLRELHRHFLRLPDGAVVEVFGDISVPGLDKDMKSALEKGSARDVENMLSTPPGRQRMQGQRSAHTRSGFNAGDPGTSGSESPLPTKPGLHGNKKSD